jgi:hypothetical protein
MTPSEPASQNSAQSTAPDPQLVTTLPDGRKVKTRLLKQRACNEKDAKGKLCAGHLKRWYAFGAEIAERFGKDAEIYRCENCKTVYLPNPEETPRSGTLAY